MKKNGIIGKEFYHLRGRPLLLETVETDIGRG